MSEVHGDMAYEEWRLILQLEKQEPLPTLASLLEEVKRCRPGAVFQLDTPEWQDALQMLSDLGYALYCVARQQVGATFLLRSAPFLPARPNTSP